MNEDNATRKITVRIPIKLSKRAKIYAVRENTTLADLVVEGLKLRLRETDDDRN